jgi:predicted nuclease of predicted toxin-antitoxin system
LRKAGHDVLTVRDQGFQGATDDKIFHVCADEQRTLITLDHDFGQVLRFPPDESAGIVVLELARQASPQSLLDRLNDLLEVLKTHTLTGKLWVVEAGRVRIHIQRDDD